MDEEIVSSLAVAAGAIAHAGDMVLDFVEELYSGDWSLRFAAATPPRGPPRS